MRNPEKGHSSLRTGRRSAKGCLYFLTLCLTKGQTGMDVPKVFNFGLELAQKYEMENRIEIHALVVMPDHLHMLIRLLSETRLEDFVKFFKGRFSPVFRKIGIKWQRGYYDRLIREADPIDVVIRYMLMNPYRKGLIDNSEKWPFWFCSDQARGSMGDESSVDRPMPEWLLQ